MEEKGLGIENLESILRFSVSTGKTIVQDLGDGKIDAKEAIELVLLVPKGMSAFKNLKQAIEEAKDIDADEARDLIIAILEELGIEEE